MGKSNRIRNQRANTRVETVKSYKKKTGMPSWAINLITIAVTLVILLSVALSVLTANGVFMRMQTAMRTDNFKVNGNMMNYFFQTQYSSFVSENSSYLSYYGLDTGLSLKDQYVNTNDQSQGTWFDYMMTQTKSSVAEKLVYCEEAESRGIKLTDEDKATIDAELDMYETYADAYGYTSTNTYIAAIYGKGMKVKDIRNALELSTLASKCSEEVGIEIENGITKDQINSEYANNKLDYDLVDYTYFTFDVSYEDAIEEILGEDYDDADAEAKSEEIIAKYKEMIVAAKADAAALAGKTDVNEFKAYIYNKVVEEAIEDTYADAVADSELTSDKLPSDENTNTIREKLLAHVVDLLKNDKDYEKLSATADDKTTVFEIEVTAEYAELFEEIAEDVVSNAKTAKDKYIIEGAVYVDTEDAIEWAFEEGRKVGDIKSFEEGDGADNEVISTDADELNSFSISTYFITKAQYRDETITKDLGLMKFSTEEDAKKAIERLVAGISLDTFESISVELGGSFTDYENYTEGSMGVDAFDEWLYGDGVVVGSYTTAAIKLSDSSYAVALYYADGDPAWEVTVKSSLFTEKFSANYATLEVSFPVTTKDKVLAKIDG